MARTKANDEKEAAAKQKKLLEKAPLPPPTPVEIFHRNLTLLDTYTEARDPIMLSRVFRYISHLRAHLPHSALKFAIDLYLSGESKVRLHALLATLPVVAVVVVEEGKKEGGVTGAPAAAAAPAAPSPASGGVSSSTTPAPTAAAATVAPTAPPKPRIPRPGGASAVELEVYLWIQVLSSLCAARLWHSLQEGSQYLLDTILAPQNRRTLDAFQARAFHYLLLSHEAQNKSGPRGAPPSLRPRLLLAHRTACLRHDEVGQATLVNLLLRSYIAHKEFEAARALLSKVHFPEAASTTQLVRFLYYTGRVKAVQLEYSAAHSALLQASRKAPSGAHAIQTAITAFLVTVELLMGDIPERSLFARAPLTLHPYMAVTRSMRNGNLGEFWGAMASHAPVFAATGTLTLLRRLEANVIRTGLRRVAAAYSTISFQDIARRLNLGGGEEAEFMCAKAVKDGVLDAVLDHTQGVLVCQPRRNVYCTREPQEAFHRRITFCLDVHNEAVQAMRYRPRAVRSDLESAEAKIAREKEEEALEEFMKMEGEEEEDDEM